MICLLSQGNWLPFDDDEAVVSYLANKLVVADGGSVEGMTPSSMRHMLAQRFRAIVQAHAIALFPVETLTLLTPQMREILHEPTPDVEYWETLPPLAVVARTPADIPEWSTIDGHDTVWVIDCSSSETLLDSLAKYDVISIQRL